MYGRGSWKTTASTGRRTVQLSDAIDTTLTPKSSTKYTPIRLTPLMGIMPMAAPAPVATPLPPLPRRKME